jgi:cold-inducible RNA-binding protein
MKKLFVGSLAWGTTDDSLREAFESFGAVSDAKVITDRETGRSRGFGFVTFEQPEDADAAIEAMNGAELDGRNIAVNEAQDRRREGGGGGGGGGGGRPPGGGGGGRGGAGGGGGGRPPGGGGGGGRGGAGGGGGGGGGGRDRW